MTIDTPCRALTAIALAVLLASAPGRQAAAQETTGEAAAETATEAESPAAEESETDAEVDAAPPTPYDVVATVNGQEILLGELLVVMETLPQQYQQLPDEILSRGLVEQLVDQFLMAQAAEATGADKSTRAAFTLQTRRRASLAESYMIVELDKRVTDESVRAAYDEQVADAEPVEEVRASHILVAEEEKAKELRAQLDGGADFADLAAEHGTDGTAQRGGDLGFFTFEDMVPEFAEAAFAIEPGTVGGPVKSAFGWHLIKVVEKRERPAPSFEELEPQLRSELFSTAQREIVEELRAGAEVQITEPGVPASAIRDPDLLNLPAPE